MSLARSSSQHPTTAPGAPRPSTPLGPGRASATTKGDPDPATKLRTTIPLLVLLGLGSDHRLSEPTAQGGPPGHLRRGKERNQPANGDGDQTHLWLPSNLCPGPAGPTTLTTPDILTVPESQLPSAVTRDESPEAGWDQHKASQRWAIMRLTGKAVAQCERDGGALNHAGPSGRSRGRR